MQEWKSWCRLCACDGFHEVDIFHTELGNKSSIAEDLKNLCNLKLESESDLPTKICMNCNSIIIKIKNFLTNIAKTQKLLMKLLYNQTNDCNSLRKQYKLPINSEIKKEDCFQNTEILNQHKIQEDISIYSDMNFSPKDSENEEKILININSKDDYNDTSIKCKNDCKTNDYLNVLKKTKSKIFRIKTKKQTLKTKEINLKNTKCSTKETKLKVKKERRKVDLKKIQCNLCEKKYVSEGGLKFHMKIKHSIDKEPEKAKEFLCRHCDRKFTSESGRWSHIYTVHDKRMTVICEECGKEFSTKHHLARHKVSHKEEKNFQCHHCPARFKGKVGLATHIQIHSESMFPCIVCGIVLKTKQLMKNHMLVHSDVKNFKCNFCNKDFKRLNGLYYHLIMHIGIKPFECRICNEKFVHNMSYLRHLKSMHPKEFAEMIAKGERISCRNFPPLEQLKALNEAAKSS